ncbi:hypothetical protein WBP07_10100 [Novosphingobium sp. BL-8A]|uniref:hypothetical protein n=1 Tax=Novosphingobium sp. BL-8A TaxID=3127639 RepID=UPI00375797EE
MNMNSGGEAMERGWLAANVVAGHCSMLFPLPFGLGLKLINGPIEAPKWRTTRAEGTAGRAGCPSKVPLVRDGSHLGVPSGFDQNGPSLCQEALKYGHIPAPSFLALSHFASNLDGAVYEFKA